jgi:N-acetylglucosamine malate deacetylase 2
LLLLTSSATRSRKPSTQNILARAVAPESSHLPLPRALLVFAHPDDETIALGARIRRMAGSHLVHATDGAPRNEQDSRACGFRSFLEYRAARSAELACMLRQAGIESMSRECLGIPDQQAALRLAALTRELARRIPTHRPEVIFTHPYEGGHPDHDACAFAVHQAVALAAGDPPVIIECASYHAGPHGMEIGTFLPPTAPVPHTPPRELSFALSRDEKQRKLHLLDCFTTQQGTLGPFRGGEERFRVAPPCDFTRPPHPSPVFYDHFPWGMTSARFCSLARDALRTLGAHAEAA